MTDKKLLKRIEKLRDKAFRLEAEAKVYYEQAEVLRNDGNESLLDLADKFEDKADNLTYEADELNLQADELQDELDDLRYNAKVDDTPKIKTLPKRKVEMETWDDTSQRRKKVFESYLEMAQQGNIIAIYEVGNCFYNGLGVEKNIAEALKWYKLAAEGGDLVAQARLNEMFDKGEISEMFTPEPYSPPKKKFSKPISKPKKKSPTAKKKSYDGNFGDVDARLSALYNSEKFGYEDSSNDDDDD